MLRQISVRARMLACMAIAGLALCALAAWGLRDDGLQQQRVNALLGYSEAAHGAEAEMREGVATMRYLEAQMIALGASNTVETERLHGLWKVQVAKVDANAERFVKGQAQDDEMSALVAQQRQLLGAYAQAIGPIAQQLQAATMDAPVALAFAGKAEDTVMALRENVGKTLALQAQRLEARKAEHAHVAQTAAMLRLAVALVALGVFVPFMALTLQSVCRPIDAATSVAARIAQGDLTAQIDAGGKDEPARLLRALSAMQVSLRNIVGGVRLSAEGIEAASRQVAHGNADLSQRTEQTHDHLQQANGSIGQLGSTVKQNADNARQADQLAQGARAVAAQGGVVVARVVETMKGIDQSSKRIADITGVIDGIAFQTNILALNAAVEAARAGEQGRGFAVVASEVRTLAQRSAGAAKEIKTLIDASVQRTEQGTALVGEAGATIAEVVQAVQRVAAIVGEISSASHEQSADMAHVGEAVAQIHQATQQNAALVDQSAEASESLKTQAQDLVRAVSVFKLAQANGGSLQRVSALQALQ